MSAAQIELVAMAVAAGRAPPQVTFDVIDVASCPCCLLRRKSSAMPCAGLPMHARRLTPANLKSCAPLSRLAWPTPPQAVLRQRHLVGDER